MFVAKKLRENAQWGLSRHGGCSRFENARGVRLPWWLAAFASGRARRSFVRW